jgi:ElaB/YqjD/DUF883 family membrane-anchored ribosome-binding protein
MADGFLSGLARRLTSVAEDARDRAEEHGRDGYRRAERYGRDAYRDARHGGQETLGELRRLWSRIEDLVEDRVAPAAGDYARGAGHRALDYARTAGRYAAEYGPQARDAALVAADYLRGATRARPLVAIGIAIAATWLIASMMRSDRRR